MITFKEYLKRRIPQFDDAIIDIAVGTVVQYKRNEITAENMEDTFDRLNLSKRSRERIIAFVYKLNLCEPHENHSK